MIESKGGREGEAVHPDSSRSFHKSAPVARMLDVMDECL